jgi:hypothetical protein
MLIFPQNILEKWHELELDQHKIDRLRSTSLNSTGNILVIDAQ